MTVSLVQIHPILIIKLNPSAFISWFFFDSGNQLHEVNVLRQKRTARSALREWGKRIDLHLLHSLHSIDDNMEARAEHQKVKNYNVLYVVDTVLGAGAVLLIFIWILHFRSGFGWQSKPHLEFNWHPLLMVLSLVFIFAQCE